MTEKERMADWAMSLKPGDKVVWYWISGDKPSKVLTVQKVTPTGIVRTDGGSFAQTKYSVGIYGLGNTSGQIKPATEDTVQEALDCMAKEEEHKRKENIIRIAKNVCYDLAYGKVQITYEIAAKILELVKESGDARG